MSLIANAKAKITTGNVKEAFKNEAGAIDLASIMVGIIVIGLIGGVIAATVFAIIPWAQDNAAKQQLDSVNAAQASYIGLTADKGNTHFGGNFVSSGTQPDGSFAYTYTKGATIGGETPSATAITEKLFDAPSGSKIAVGRWGNGTGAHYGAAVKSASGKTWYITDTKTHPAEATPASFPDVATSEIGEIVNKVKNL
jgi:hypothetical protein